MKTISSTLFTLFITLPLLSQAPIEVKVDRRIELLRIVWNLAFEKKLPKDVKPTPSLYHDEVKAYFKKYKKHQAVKLLKDAWIFDYSFPRVGVALDDTYQLTDTARISSWEERYGPAVIRNILSAIEQFAQASNYNTFFEQRKTMYRQMVSTFEKDINQKTWLKDVCQLFGCPNLKKVIIYFEPLNNCGNYEISNTNSNTPEIGLAYLSDDPTQLKKEARKPVVFILENWIQRVFYHELCHYFTSALTYSSKENLQEHWQCFYEQAGQEESSNWINHVDETIVRAYVAYLFAESIDEKEGQAEVDRQKRNYFRVDQLYQIIREQIPYTDQRNEHQKVLDNTIKVLKKLDCN